jgi:hypothetical protein
MVSVQSIGVNSPSFKQRSYADTESHLETIYKETSQASTKGTIGARIVPATVLTVLGIVAGKKFAKFMTDNDLTSKIVEKVKEPVTNLIKKIPSASDVLGRIENEKVNKVATRVVDAVKTGVDKFARFDKKETSAVRGFIKNGAAVTGGVYGFKKGIQDKDGNGVSDVKDVFRNTEKTITLAGELAEALTL